MADPSDTRKPGGALGYARDLLNSPGRMDKMGCAWGAAAVVAVAVIAMLIWSAVMGGNDEAAVVTPPSSPVQSAQESASPAVENPTPVGQALDAIAQPALAEVYGEATLASAPPAQALIVSLAYDIPNNPAPGDGKKVRDALIRRGATVDPDNSEMDYHAGEEFMLLFGTGNPAFKTVRVNVNPESATVYVNADKSE